MQAVNDKMNGETNSPDRSNENGTIVSTIISDGGNTQGRPPRKPKLKWKSDLQQKFLEAIDHLGLRKAMPKTIQEFMNVKGITRTHIASHLQKYRRHLKKLKQKARRAELAKRINRELTSSASSSCILDPQDSYKNGTLNLDNLFKSQLGYAGQSSLLLKNNVSRNYMSNLLPVGGSRGYSSGVLPFNNEVRSFQVSRVPGLGKYGIPSFMRSNYTGMTNVYGKGNLHGADGAGRVDGYGYGSPGESLSDHGRSTPIVPSTFGKTLANGGQTQSNLLAQMDALAYRRSLGTSQAPRFGQYGTRNEVYNAGINTNEYGAFTGLGGARFTGSLGENVGTMKMDFNSSNMTNHGSSTYPFSSFFASEDRIHRNLTAQLDGLIPTLQNLSVCNDDTGNTVNSQFDQNQGQVSAGNSRLSNNVPDGNATSNSKFDLQLQKQLRVKDSELSNDALLENIINNWNNFDIHHEGQVSAGTHELSNTALLQMFTTKNRSFNNYQGQVGAGNPESSNNVLLEKNAIDNWNVNNHQDQVGAGKSEMFNNVLLEGNAINNYHQGLVSAGNPNLSNGIVHGENMINNWSYDNHQGQVSAGNFGLSNDMLLEGNASNNWSFNNYQSQVNVGNYELANDVLQNPFSNGSWNFGNVNDNPTEETFKSVDANSRMYMIPNPGMNTINQEEQSRNDQALNYLAVNSEMYPTPDMNANANNQKQGSDESTLNSIAASSEMRIPSPTPDISTLNLEQGVALLPEVPFPALDLDWMTGGDCMDLMIDVDDLF